MWESNQLKFIMEHKDLIKCWFADDVTCDGCRCTLSPHGGISRRFYDGDSDRGSYSISRCCDVIYFAARQPGISDDYGQHVLQRGLFLDAFSVSCSLLLHVYAGATVPSCILMSSLNASHVPFSGIPYLYIGEQSAQDNRQRQRQTQTSPNSSASIPRSPLL